MSYTVHRLSNDFCDVWIAGVTHAGVQYCYGGTRMVAPGTSDAAAEQVLVQLMAEESGIKNELINYALSTDLLGDLAAELPPGYLDSRVGGGRCILRPRTDALYTIMRHPAQPGFEVLISHVFKEIGEHLNAQRGRFKLTPDFGRFAGLADLLYRYTPHVLGIRCSDGGCGGKASYTTTGILAALDHLDLLADRGRPLTLIGAAGALGSIVLDHYLAAGYRDLAICDLAYDDGTAAPPAAGRARQLPAERGRFTDDCLRRGGALVMTTDGGELAASNVALVPSGSTLVLAHNLAIEPGERGIELMRALAARRITVIPGQLLTLGGALTSRLEWFWRQAHPGKDFNKPLAHEIVSRVSSHLLRKVAEIARIERVTPFEAMWLFHDAAASATTLPPVAVNA